MKEDPILEEVKDRIGFITLNRPDAFNAVNYEMMCRLEETVQKFSSRKDISAIAIRGAGKAFCAGADLKSVLSNLDKPEKLEEYVDQIGRAFDSLETFPLPVVAVVQDYALAGGFELLQACDIIIAAETARMGDQHANFWMIPGGGGAQRLAFSVGLHKAKDLLFTGRWLSGKEAVEAGIVSRAVPAEDLDACLDELLTSLSEKSPVTLRKMKELINYNFKPVIRKGLEYEKSVFLRYIQSPSASEGLNAFSEKRKPQLKNINY